MRANQMRLWFASFAYVLLCALRRIGLAHTQFANATCGTIRRERWLTHARSRRFPHSGTDSSQTLRWRRQSRANPSLEAGNSLLASEFTGNLARSSAQRRHLRPNPATNSTPWDIIPCVSEQGIILAEQGIKLSHQGIFWPDQGRGLTVQRPSCATAALGSYPSIRLAETPRPARSR
jgi:hypothetical protein